MSQSTIVDTLDQITGSWKPAASATSGDLDSARRALAAALAGGLPVSALHATPSPHASTVTTAHAAIDELVRSVSDTPFTVLPSVRSATDIDPAAGALVAGMKVEKTLGPFADAVGALHWIDLIPLPQKVEITGSSAGELGYVTVTDPTSATFGAGSLWIAAGRLGIPGVTAGFVGLSFATAAVTSTGAVKRATTGIVVPLGASLTLELTLAPPVPGTFTAPIGADAQAAALALPPVVTIEFTAAGVVIASVGASSATLYGSSLTLQRNAVPPRAVTAGLRYILFPCDVSLTTFAFATVQSADVVPSGSAPVATGGWALPITTASAAQLGAANSAGAALLELGVGAALQFGSQPAPASLGSVTLLLAPGTIVLSATNAARTLHIALALWSHEASPAGVVPAASSHGSELDFTVAGGRTIYAAISPASELVVALGSAKANVDRPLAADGRRIPFAFANALLAFMRVAGGTLVLSEMTAVAAPAAYVFTKIDTVTIALENALLRVAPAQSALLVAEVEGVQLIGVLQFVFGAGDLVPMLPDPYAEGNVSPVRVAAGLSARVSWNLASGAVLSFAMPDTTAQATPLQNVGATLAVAAPVDFGTTLLDLSTNADQFGVSLNQQSLYNNVSFDGLAIAVPQERLTLYALPGISWEPVVDDSTNDWFKAATANDGPPTGLTAGGIKLVPVRPDVALADFALASATEPVRGTFTLPFGLIASLATTPKATHQPSMTLVDADYANGMSVARQLSIRATGPQNQTVIPQSTAALPGSVTTGSPLPIASTTIFFEQEFSTQSVPAGTPKVPEIPVARIDISGYGTSMFSDWANTDLQAPGVARSNFDVIVGRTAYELVQIQSIIYPWCVRITETVIFERFDGGLVVRHDTGWKAVGDAQLDVFPAAQRFLGALERLTNVHNIVPTNGTGLRVRSVDPLHAGRIIDFVPITFDADAVLAAGANGVTATANGSVGKPVAASGILGYAQTTALVRATDIEILQLMSQVPDGVSGTLGAIVNVGGAPSGAAPQFTVNVSSINVKASSATKTGAAGKTYPAAVAVALYGTPRLPRDGAWSITRRSSSANAPTTVDPAQPIPLISAPDTHNVPQWRLLDPSDVLQAATPDTVFGLLQGSGTSKTLFENPIVQAGGKALSLDPTQGVPAPNLADVGALLGAADIFPNLANVLKIPTAATDALALVNDGFQKTFKWPIQNDDGTTLADQTLLDLGIVTMALQYHGPDANGNDGNANASFTIDAAPPAGQPRWSLDLEQLSMAVFVQGFGSDALLTIHGGFQASETTKAGFVNIAIDYGTALALIKQLLTGIQDVVEAIGGVVDLDVGFSGNQLTVNDSFALPVIPLGLGQLENIGLNLGLAITIPTSAEFSVGFASPEDPFTWVCDPLTGNGTIQLGTKDGDIDVFIEAGIGVALELNLAIASGGASIMLDFSLNIAAPDITISVALTGNAFVDVLDGLASASLTLTAAISVELIAGTPREADFSASVAVGIHLTVAWVISVDFDGSWAFSKTIALSDPL
jgi:hypothetical protein